MKIYCICFNSEAENKWIETQFSLNPKGILSASMIFASKEEAEGWFTLCKKQGAATENMTIAEVELDNLSNYIRQPRSL